MSLDNHTLSDLMSFVVVADEKSFTNAATKMGVTHSVISKRLNRLEASLNTRLINRTTRRLALTESGQALYERCAQIKKDIEEAMLAMNATQDRPCGTLRVNAPMGFAQLHLISTVCDFMRAYPEIHVELVLGRQFANLLEHGLDVSIQISEMPDSSFIARRLAQRSTYVCASPAYFEQHPIPKNLEELKQHNCLIYHSHKAHEEWRFIENGQEKMIRVQGNFHVNSSQAIKRAALNGLGIARVPGYLIDDEIRSGKLISLFAELCPRDIGIYAVYPHNRHLAAKVRVFIDFLVERFARHEWNE